MDAEYSCDPTVCKAPECRCASQSSPLPVEQTPQFVVFTHDDSTAGLSTGLMQSAVGDNKNPNGCRLPVTYFTMQGYSDCDIIKQRWQDGDEIAGHTVTHEAMGPNYTETEQEIVGQRNWLINECGIPAEDVVGHRSPYLVNNPKHREALAKGGFLYDSTINEHWPDSRLPGSEPNSQSPNGNSRLWPYTLDNGIPQNCAWTGNLCKDTERYKRLWEVPVWNIQTDFYPDNAYAMDPCDMSKIPCNVYNLMKSNFELAYNGNRAPVPLYVHSPWLAEPKNMKDVQKFITWARKEHPNDVYFVTMHQLIQWLENPVPLSQMDEWLGCVAGGNAAGAASKPKSTTPVTQTVQAVVPEPAAPGPIVVPLTVAPEPTASPLPVVPEPVIVAPSPVIVESPQLNQTVASAVPEVVVPASTSEQVRAIQVPSSANSVLVSQAFFLCSVLAYFV